MGCERPIATEDTGPSHQPLRWLEWISLVLGLTLDLKVSDECSTTELRPDYPFSFLVLVRFGLGHLVGECQNWDFNPGSQVTESAFCT